MNQKKSSYSNLLLLISLSFFSLSLMVFLYKNFLHFGINQEILKRKKSGILVTSYQDKKLVFATIISVYPSLNKVGLYFINPLTRFEKDGKSLLEMELGATGEIKDKIEEITGFKIHNKVEIGAAQFIRIVDLTGGISVFTEPFTVRSGTHFQRSPGEYNMSGEDLLDYLTVLEKNEPLEYIHRISRQESVILTAYEKINTTEIHKAILKLVYELLETDMSVDDFMALYQFMQSTHLIFSVSELPGEPAVHPGGRLTLEINTDTVKTAFHKFESEINSDYFLDGEKSRIEILNFTETNGLARNIKAILQDKRLKVLSTSNGWDSELEKSIVLDRSGNTEYSYKTAEALDIHEVRHSIRKDIGMDTTVLLGNDIAKRFKE